MISKIQLTAELPLLGQEGSLENRLREVSLRGFPHVSIYKNASFVTRRLDSDQIARGLYTAQPHVHEPYLQRINRLADLFSLENVDIFHLDKAYDYIAYEDGDITEWTMLPPITEQFSIPRHPLGGFNYLPLLGPDLQSLLDANNQLVNPETTTANYYNPTNQFSLINDGAHRVHAGLQNGKGITVIDVSNMESGYPYYGSPQHYSTVQVFSDREQSKDLKINVLTPPAHKLLYRDFPSGGIKSGTVRPLRAGEQFI